ncbi:MAG: prenyltransferase/squalene oxidase repeat-containing protein [Verrucomicrobiota bacterium]
MSIRLQMLQVARLAPKLLGDSADLVKHFFLAQHNADGGFKDRQGRSDLYYTVFGLDGLLALQAEFNSGSVFDFLEEEEHWEELDFVHLCCLARCRAALEQLGPSERRFSVPRHEILDRVEMYRTPDGGYSQAHRSNASTTYASFLALGAYQDLKAEMPQPERMLESIYQLRTPDGAWANDRSMKVGSTNATAAALTVLRQFDEPAPAGTGDWLMARAHPQGGFLAAPQAPLPDLLSTATALHALAGLEMDLAAVKEPCLDFIDSLWTNAGGFHGHWSDDALDVEYTYYGLLALGHLSL